MMRYAIYFTPQENSLLAAEAAKWLGRDVHGYDRHTENWPTSFSPEDFAKIIASPYHYGFHGTIKPPFRLQPGKTVEHLEKQLEEFTQKYKAFHLPPLKIDYLHNFFCLRPTEKSDNLHRLACDTVRSFDHFRKPPSGEELKKRRAADLSVNQEKLLQEWGYPYVMDEFRFHLTLTGMISCPKDRHRIELELLRRFDAEICDSVSFSELGLFIEEDGQPLICHKQFPFSQ